MRPKNSFQIGAAIFRPGLTVLAIGAHPDDVELGAAATIMRLLDEYHAKVFYRVFSYGPPWDVKSPEQDYRCAEMKEDRPQDRAVEAMKAALRLGLAFEVGGQWQEAFKQYSAKYGNQPAGSGFERFRESETIARVARTMDKWRMTKTDRKAVWTSYATQNVDVFDMFDFPDMLFPNSWHEVKEKLEKTAGSMRKYLRRQTPVPGLVLHHTFHDVHQDHHELGTASIRAFRRGETRLAYGILQYEPGGFTPNLYVNVSGHTVWAREVFHDETPQDLKQEETAQFSVVIKDEMIDGVKFRFKRGSYAQRKADLIRECYRTQYKAGRFFMVPDRVLGIMRTSAISCGYEVDFAEPFEGRVCL